MSNLCQLLTTGAVHEGPNHATATRKKDFFPCFVYLFIVIRISRFILFTSFGYPHIFSPHFSMRIFPSAMHRYQVLVLQIPKWNLRMRESLVMTSAYDGTSVLREDFEGGSGEGVGVFWDWGWRDWQF